jgi:hypothetical protein
VEAVLKNMEYSAMDDKKKEGAGASNGDDKAPAAEDAALADDASLGEVKGFR